MAYNIEKTAKTGMIAKVHYAGSLVDGTVFDNSRERGTPIAVQLGQGKMIPAFEKAIEGMTLGETKKINLKPDEAYGDVKPQLFHNFPKNEFPEDLELLEGGLLNVPVQDGRNVPARIHEITDAEVILNFNHPMAGKEINFEIELMELEESSDTKNVI